MIDLSQKQLLGKVEQYLRLLALTEEGYTKDSLSPILRSLSYGQCIGFDGLYTYFKYNGKENQLRASFTELAGWPGTLESLTPEMKNNFNQLIHWIRVFFDLEQAVPGTRVERQLDRRAQMEMLGSESFPKEQLRFSYFFNDATFRKVLTKLFSEKKDTYIDLDNHNHQVSICCKDGVISFYNSNDRNGEVICENIGDLMRKVKLGFHVNKRDPHYPLSWTVYGDEACYPTPQSIYHYLHQSMPDVILQDKTPLSVVHFATKFNDLNAVTHALKVRPDLINRPSFSRKTPLHYALQFNVDALIDYYILNRADLNATDENGMTPLHAAIQNSNMSALTRIIQNGSRIDWRAIEMASGVILKPGRVAGVNVVSFTPHQANPEMLEKLLQFGGHVLGDQKYFSDLLIAVAGSHNHAILHQLIRYGESSPHVHLNQLDYSRILKELMRRKVDREVFKVFTDLSMKYHLKKPENAPTSDSVKQTLNKRPDLFFSNGHKKAVNSNQKGDADPPAGPFPFSHRTNYLKPDV